jgi:hypothetical protein
MSMFALYLKILALNIGLSDFVVLLAALVQGGVLKLNDFVFPAAIQFLLVSVIFIVLDLLREREDQAEVDSPAHVPKAVPVVYTSARRNF